MKAVNMMKLVFVAVIFICGCTKTESNLVGAWSNLQTPESVEFKADKSGLFLVKDQPSLAFVWKVVDNDRVKVDINFHGSVRTLIGKVEGDRFVLEGSGQKATYRRIQQ
jgi:hypothetical protein